MRTLASVGFLLVISVFAVRAHEVDELDRSAVYINGFGAPSEREPIVVQRIATETGLPVNVVREQRARTNLGYGELLVANSLASASGHSFDEIISRHSGGAGWGRIAQDYGLKLGPIVSRAHHAENALKHAKVKGKKSKKGGKDRDDDDGDGEGGHGKGAKGPKSHGHGH